MMEEEVGEDFPAFVLFVDGMCIRTFRAAFCVQELRNSLAWQVVGSMMQRLMLGGDQ